MNALAQTVDTLAAGLDWKHLLLALAIPLAGYAGTWLGKRGAAFVEEKLLATGHPQAAQAFDLLVKNFSAVATDVEKQALAQAAKDQGVDHPAIVSAVK